MRLDKTLTHKALVSAAETMSKASLNALFESSHSRVDDLSLQGPHIFLDYSKHLIDSDVMNSLMQLANENKLDDRIKGLFSGEKVNNTEKRPALHTALRADQSKPIMVDGVDITEEIAKTHAQIERFVDRVHQGNYRGYTGKAIKCLVSIGIGGSFLGPKMITEALSPYSTRDLSCFYVSNIDAHDLVAVLDQIDPEETLFLIQSKSFSTLETLQNAQSALTWLQEKGLSKKDISKHLLAVTSKPSKAMEFGIAEDAIFPMWDWVGGRYSLWSAIGIPIAFMFGMTCFNELLQGARDMDEHFESAPLEKNMPVIMALLGVWYSNYLGAESHAVLPYDHNLRFLPDHLQQLDMESNGKSVDLDGETLSYQSGPIIWGGAGTNGQHAYHQLLHQGTRLIPADFIIPIDTHHPLKDHHHQLVANGLSQAQALMQGKSYDMALSELLEEGYSEDDAKWLAKHKVIQGNKPSNMLVLEKLTPASLGALVALYEHKVFVQGVVWNVNSFDQWGVELGKTMGSQIYQALLGETKDSSKFDASTEKLIELFKPNS